MSARTKSKRVKSTKIDKKKKSKFGFVDLLPESNIFLEKHKKTATAATGAGRKVYEIKATYYTEILDYTEEGYGKNGISGDSWYERGRTQIFLISHKDLDSWGIDKIGKVASEIVDRYYEGQEGENFIDRSFKLKYVNVYDNTNIKDLKLKGKHYHVTLLDKISKNNIKARDGYCLFDYIVNYLTNKKGFKKYTKLKFMSQFRACGVYIDNGISISDLEKWIKKYNHNVSYYAVTIDGKIISKGYTPQNTKPINLAFMIHDNHIYPIINDELSGNNLKDVINIINCEPFKEIKEQLRYFPSFDYTNFEYISINEFVTNANAIINGKYKTDKSLLVIERCRDMKQLNYNITLMEVGNEIIKATNTLINNIDVDHQSFRHPISHQYYSFASDFMDRSEICKVLSKSTQYNKYLNFKFNNQSMGVISGILKNIEMDNHEQWKSSFNPILLNKLDKYALKPIHHGYKEFRDCYSTSAMDPIQNINEINDDALYDYNTEYINEYGEIKRGRDLKNLTDLKLEDINYYYKPKFFTIDKRKCYPTAIVKYLKNAKIPIYTTLDSETKFDNNNDWIYDSNKNMKVLPVGMYYVKGWKIEPYGIQMETAYYPHFILNIFIEDDVLDIDCIKSKVIARKYMSGSILSDFVIKIFDILPSKYAKNVVNTWTGLFNRKYKTDDTVLISNSVQFVIGMINEYNNNMNGNYNIDIKQLDDLFWLRLGQKTRVISDTSIIYSYILAGGIASTYEMCKSIWKPSYELVGIKTDGLYIRNGGDERPVINEPQWDETKPTSIKQINKYPYKFEYNKQPPFKFDDKKQNYENFKENKWNVIKFNNRVTIDDRINQLAKLDGCVIDAGPGAGKTYTMVKLFGKFTNEITDKKTVMLAFQGSVVANFQRECRDQGIDSKYIYTLDYFMGRTLVNGKMMKTGKQQILSKNIFAIFIDEKSQLSEDHVKCLTILYNQNPKIKFYTGGDYNQCQSVSWLLYLIDTSDTLKTLHHNNYVKLKYNQNHSRFNSSSNQIKYIKYLMKHKKLHPDFFEKDKNGNYIYESNDLSDTKYHITAFRKVDNGCNAINKAKSSIKNNKKYNEFNGISVGDPIICNYTFENENELKIYTGQPFTALAVNKKKKTVLIEVYDGGKIKKDYFPIKYENKNILMLGNAETIYRFQGQTMEEPMTIHNGEHMTYEAILTSISRPRHHNHIKFSNIESLKDLTFKSAYEALKEFRIPSQFSKYDSKRYKNIKPMKNNEYADWILYQINDDNNDKYDGIVKLSDNNIQKSMDNRVIKHKKDKGVVSKMKNPTISTYYGNNEPTLIHGKKSSAEKIEQIHIRNDKSIFGSKLINKDIHNLPTAMNDDTMVELNSYQSQIEALLNNLSVKAPTKKTPYYSVYSIQITSALNKKKRQINSTNKDKLINTVETGILKSVFGPDWDKPQNIKLFMDIKDKYQNDGKYLIIK